MMEKTEEIEGLEAEFEKETAEREEYDVSIESQFSKCKMVS